MMQATQTRFDSIEIPERPAVAAQPVATLSALLRKRMVLWGGIAAAALLALIVIATAFSGSSRKVVRLEEDAPLIKGGDQPLKVSPDKSGAATAPAAGQAACFSVAMSMTKRYFTSLFSIRS